jgi:hypothetical protein
LQQRVTFHQQGIPLAMLTLLQQIIIFIFGQALLGQMLDNLLDQQEQPVQPEALALQEQLAL